MRRFYFRGLIVRVGLVLIALIVGLSISEIILRVVNSNSYNPIWQANLKKIFSPASEIMPGVNGRKRFSINSKGFRGDEFSKENKYHVLAIGGSTTECLFLDDKEAWPYLTQTLINEKGFQIWIGNVGKSRASISNHIIDFNKIIKRFPLIDAVIVMVGINDLTGALESTLEAENEKGGKVTAATPLYKRTALWKLECKVKNQFFFRNHELIQNEAGAFYEKWRRNRMSAEKYNAMPNLSKKLSEYKTSLNRFVDVAKQANVRVIFMTQPTMWRNDLSAEEEQLFWFGWGGMSQTNSKKYYSVDILEKVMALFNKMLLEVCSNRGVECIDLAASMGKDTTTFYDDCHFNTSGSRKVAEILSRYLLMDAPVRLPY